MYVVKNDFTAVFIVECEPIVYIYIHHYWVRLGNIMVGYVLGG